MGWAAHTRIGICVGVALPSVLNSQRLLFQIKGNDYFSKKLVHASACVYRDIEHAGGLESTKEA